MVDVDSVIDPVHQIVPTLLDVPYSTDDVVAPRLTTEEDQSVTSHHDAAITDEVVAPRLTAEEAQPVTTSHHDAAISVAESAGGMLHELTPLSTDVQENRNIDNVTAEYVDNVTVQSVDQPESSSDPVDTMSDVPSVPDLTSEPEADTRDLLESEQT